MGASSTDSDGKKAKKVGAPLRPSIPADWLMGCAGRNLRMTDEEYLFKISKLGSTPCSGPSLGVQICNNMRYFFLIGGAGFGGIDVKNNSIAKSFAVTEGMRGGLAHVYFCRFGEKMKRQARIQFYS